MRILHNFAGLEGRAATLAILLPGALQQPEDLVEAGFIDAVRRRGLELDLALADLGIRYIGETTDGTALQRLHEEAVLPARSQGYDAVWLAGISIGGFMAMAYADRHPGMVDGLCLLAAYPGNRILTRAIREAGGIEQWQAGTDEGEDGEVQVWRWIKAIRGASTPQIFFGYGREDRFASGQELMAESLAFAHVDVVAGGHDWPAWQQLWNDFLDRIAASRNKDTRQ
ncbi:alpha/beta fold hydrolase [Noviherbaspirillum massiliense]|uniref:alpha/beta fold hydrolase n=1 Tax=Noviherbaspirillum massiliense TaxID=1465823 RepID=UPI0002DAB1A2|nr:alpha/beta hydrolase [Noviherbaspirillum massiliense]